jgi:glutathione peroxidase
MPNSLNPIQRRSLLCGLAGAGLLAALSGAPARAETRLDWRAVPLPGIDGEPLAPAAFEGKVVLLVNTASFCGYTGQYAELQAIWRRYRARGLVVLGVPSNDFGSQEPGANAAIKSFCELNYGVDFPLLEKQSVIGPSAHPLYRWAARVTGPAGVPRWNFHKILIGRDGRLAAWFATAIKPDDAAIVRRIEAALAAARR